MEGKLVVSRWPVPEDSVLVTMFGAGEEELKALGASHVTWPYFANLVLVNGCDMSSKSDGSFVIISYIDHQTSPTHSSNTPNGRRKERCSQGIQTC